MKQQKLFLRFLFTIIMLIPLLANISSTKVLAQSQFSDLQQGDFGYEQIINLYERGVVSGFPNNQFHPKATLNRAQAAVMFQRALQLPTPSGLSGFKDVKQGLYYSGAVAATKQAGIFKGNSDGTFGPDEQLSREQMASLLVRVLDLKTNPKVAVTISDLETVHPIHQNDVLTLYQNGITKGKSGNLFDPKGKVTRSEFSVFVVRSLGDRLPAKKTEELNDGDEENVQKETSEQTPIIGGDSSGGSASTAPKVTASHVLTHSNNRIDAVVSGSNVTYSLSKSTLSDLSVGKITVSKDATMTVRVIIAGVDINEERTQELTQGESDLNIANTIRENAVIIEQLGSFSAQGVLVDNDGNTSEINLVFNIY